jgi:transcriptional regulator with XRE-family HTH domain
MSGYSTDPFPLALRKLMTQRSLNYRRLAYKTGFSAGYLAQLCRWSRGAPRNEVLERLAGALGVEPAHFREYRVRFVISVLSTSPELLSAVYAALCVVPQAEARAA